MALLSVQQATLSGTPVTYQAAAAGGDTFSPGSSDSVALRVKNGGASAMTASIQFPGQTPYGVNNPARQSSSIPAGTEVVIGPIPQSAIDTSTGLVSVTYSGVSSVTVAAVGH